MLQTFARKRSQPMSYVMNSKDFIFDEFRRLDDHSIMIAFRGDLTPQLTEALLELADHKLCNFRCALTTRKRAFHILVECVQNLIKHTIDGGDCGADSALSNGMIMVTANGNSVRILTGNSILKNQIRPLKDKLSTLKSVSKDSLRTHYQEQLVHGKMSPNGGAGLGFIDIARKSSHQFEYDFTPIDDNRSFFTFNVQVA